MNRGATTQTQPVTNVAPIASSILQRQCACGQHTLAGGECAQCSKERRMLQRASRNSGSVPSIVYEVLRSPGQPLDEATRAFMEPRFGHNFSHVRVHTDQRAENSAQTVNALAYTVGSDVVFGSGQFAPATTQGRGLLAHELTHVVQQQNARFSDVVESQSQSGDRFEREAEALAAAVDNGLAQRTGVVERLTTPFLGRSNARQTAAVLRQGTVRNTGLQFFPLQITSTRIGPVSGEGGLAENTRHNLLVIVGQMMTLRRLAQLLLPFWNSATPFTPPGAAAPIVSAALNTDALARGLLVYNRFHLSVLSQPTPSMTGWMGGLRFPLPVEIEANGNAVVNSELIQNLAGEFDAAWEPLLDQAASAVGTPAASLNQAATAFLAATSDVDARGLSLAARVTRNPVEALSFVTAVFNQLGAASFDVAIAFMNSSVNEEIALLASQRAGASILGIVRTALAAAPTTLSASQRQSLTRANLMLGLVRTAAARDVPFTLPSAVSNAGVQMIGGFEGFCPNLYDDHMPGCGLGQGNCTIGWGHLVHLNPCDGRASETPFLGGVTRQRADQLLAGELANTVNRVRTRVTVPLSQEQFDAVVSFVFNTGRLNALLPDLNANHFANIPGIMNQFTHSQGLVMPGLVRRRAREGALFSTGLYPP